MHIAVDGFTRLAYSEVLDDERGIAAAQFWKRADAFLTSNGSTVERVIPDNGSCYRSHDFARALEQARHTFTRLYRPQTNGKAERFNRTLLAEVGCVRTWRSDAQRTLNLATCSISTAITDTTPLSGTLRPAASAISRITTAS